LVWIASPAFIKRIGLLLRTKDSEALANFRLYAIFVAGKKCRYSISGVNLYGCFDTRGFYCHIFCEPPPAIGYLFSATSGLFYCTKLVPEYKRHDITGTSTCNFIAYSESGINKHL